ncbi:unnamed protein product [Darwinula stevensoni]|uniref:Nose resistant-to-fluoxetine protein N-terminal domain-containing protein n=1 Tax=Darwinula stevensoni TaxID=69355 RepID=A0A7R9FT95_9CRUS|nr:unnamed protein product [Darwinula stevensoni]CAG0905498.1 unnamed protein product [Darwinula stevensoni]
MNAGLSKPPYFRFPKRRLALLYLLSECQSLEKQDLDIGKVLWPGLGPERKSYTLLATISLQKSKVKIKKLTLSKDESTKDLLESQNRYLEGQREDDGHEGFYPTGGGNVTELCSNHTGVLFDELNRIDSISEWALKMVDGTRKMPSGILTGNIWALGNY